MNRSDETADAPRRSHQASLAKGTPTRQVPPAGRLLRGRCYRVLLQLPLLPPSAA